MSLTDLKKKSTRSKVTRCTVEAFINNAENYARGYDNVISINTGRPGEPENTAWGSSPPVETPTAKQPFRRATFTLSEECIESLALLSQQTGCSKSHLVRVLIQRFADG